VLARVSNGVGSVVYRTDEELQHARPLDGQGQHQAPGLGGEREGKEESTAFRILGALVGETAPLVRGREGDALLAAHPRDLEREVRLVGGDLDFLGLLPRVVDVVTDREG
jgi:hypothetical protein